MLLLAALALLVVQPAAVLAQATGPTEAQYDPRVVIVESDPTVETETGLGSRVVDPLPFTGFDVLAMAAVALALTGLGLWLQRMVSRQRRDLGA